MDKPGAEAYISMFGEYQKLNESMVSFVSKRYMRGIMEINILWFVCPNICLYVVYTVYPPCPFAMNMARVADMALNVQHSFTHSSMSMIAV